ncbi:hypothetical protein N657DRAFT_693125 [Parathielavia appendiculata]|uniref:Uncharacterized protein n=1 Tax=Parathielavia appendiculata TaxID=2587402 RepID=A0AAN6YZP6_9PEZI|nr:hypothetical protein N657DRAFT_693125 [Parathielavia appendiculata]
MSNNLDFLREDWQVKSITVHKGHPNSTAVHFEIGSFSPCERVTSGSIEVGKWVCATAPFAAILGIRLFTNHGRSLLAQARYSMPSGEGKVKKDGF